MGVSRKQSTPNFPKNEHFLPPDAIFEKRFYLVFSFIVRAGKFTILLVIIFLSKRTFEHKKES